MPQPAIGRAPSPSYEGCAIVYCEGALGTTNGKTAHGLIRRSRRYRVRSVVDSAAAAPRTGVEQPLRDAGELLDRKPNGIPIVASLAEALELARRQGTPATHFVMGLAPDGGRLAGRARDDVLAAVRGGLNVVSGLHDYLGDDPEIAEAAAKQSVSVLDLRRPRPTSALHFFTGEIEQVGACRVALLGTDSAVGKRTTAWLLVDALQAAGTSAELVGTGQTAWLQGARHSIVLDSIVNDFVAGEIEHAVCSAWNAERPDVIVLEGQGSLLNPAYPGGFELLAAGRPHCIVLQHAPGRTVYDGFPDFPLHPLERQIAALAAICEKPVVAVTLNSEGLEPAQVRAEARRITEQTGLPAIEPLLDGVAPVVEAIRPFLRSH